MPKLMVYVISAGELNGEVTVLFEAVNLVNINKVYKSNHLRHIIPKRRANVVWQPKESPFPMLSKC